VHGDEIWQPDFSDAVLNTHMELLSPTTPTYLLDLQAPQVLIVCTQFKRFKCEQFGAAEQFTEFSIYAEKDVSFFTSSMLSKLKLLLLKMKELAFSIAFVEDPLFT
jgi:hypothetical protein